jgi:ABC-2 type transport system permease protein
VDTEARYRLLDASPFTRIDSSGLVTEARGGKLREIFQRRELLGLLVRRDLQARYRDSVLGFLWTVIRPIIVFLMYFVVLGKFLRAAEGVPNFAIYLFAGLTLYSFFSEMVVGAASSIIANAGLVKKIYLPREIFPLASVGGAAVMFLIQCGVLLAAALIFGALPHDLFQTLWFFPSVALILVYGLALGIFLSAVNVYLRDVQYLLELLIMLAMWASPIVYSWQMAASAFASFKLPSWLFEVYLNSPITLGVLGFHRAFWGDGTAADYPTNLGLRILIAFVVGLVLLFFAHRVFKRLQGNFAQEL